MKKLQDTLKALLERSDDRVLLMMALSAGMLILRHFAPHKSKKRVKKLRHELVDTVTAYVAEVCKRG